MEGLTRVVLAGPVGELSTAAEETDSAVALIPAHTIRPTEFVDAINPAMLGFSVRGTTGCRACHKPGVSRISEEPIKITGFPDVSEGRRNTIELFVHANLGEKAEALQFLRTRAGLRSFTLKEGRPDADSRTRKS